MTGLQSRLLDLLDANGLQSAVMLAIDLDAPLQDVYGALVSLEARRVVHVVVPRNKRPMWMLGPGFNVRFLGITASNISSNQ
jgi:hypothetical protein